MRQLRSLLVLAVLFAGPAAAVDVSLFVPVVLSTAGENSSFFTSAMTLTNHGTTPVTVRLTYTAEAGGGSGTVTLPLAAGAQRVTGNVIEELRNLGLAIPASGTRLGTLRVEFLGASSGEAVGATVRTTTPVPPAAPIGRAGLAYSGVPAAALLNGTAFIGGLQVSSTDRSNIALQNPGTAPVTIRLSWFEGTAPSTIPAATREETLEPGRFRQLRVVDLFPAAQNGYVKLERAQGTGPFYGYGVTNDNANSDGSYLEPVLEATLAGRFSETLPVAVETATFSTEVAVANASGQAKLLRLTYVSQALETPDKTISLDVQLAAGEQRILGSFVQMLRDANPPAVPAGRTYVGPVTLTVPGGNCSGVLFGARVLNPGGGGRYGLFYQAVPSALSVPYSVDAAEAWLYALEQDAEDRTNLAIVNTGERDASTIVLRVEIWNGDTGQKVATVEGPETTLAPRGFSQLNRVLSTYASGVANAYARVTRVSGTNPFAAYVVVNDGAEPNQRSGDGAFVKMATRLVTSPRYAGSWNNTTFGSTGPISVDATVNWLTQAVSATVTIGGPVFGGITVPPFTITAAYTQGTSSTTVQSSVFGTCTISATRGVTNSSFLGTCTNIPGGFVSGFEFTGAISETRIEGTYKVSVGGSTFATGTFLLTRQ